MKNIQEIGRITFEMVSAEMNNSNKRVRLCLTNNGKNLLEFFLILSFKINFRSSSAYLLIILEGCVTPGSGRERLCGALLLSVDIM